jgi:transcription elongation factor SPT6
LFVFLTVNQDFGLKSHEVVVNYRAGEQAAKEYFIDDQDLPPIVHAEAFGDPNQERLTSPETLLLQARMLLATELGKDPLLRKDVRERFKHDGLVSVVPAEKGLTKIDDHHPYSVCLKSLLWSISRS